MFNKPTPLGETPPNRSGNYRVEVIAGAHDARGLEGKLNEYDAEGWEVLCCEIVQAVTPMGRPAPALFTVLRRKFALDVGVRT